MSPGCQDVKRRRAMAIRLYTNRHSPCTFRCDLVPCAYPCRSRADHATLQCAMTRRLTCGNDQNQGGLAPTVDYVS